MDQKPVIPFAVFYNKYFKRLVRHIDSIPVNILLKHLQSKVKMAVFARVLTDFREMLIY
jgi:hypothetical protein